MTLTEKILISLADMATRGVAVHYAWNHALVPLAKVEPIAFGSAMQMLAFLMIVVKETNVIRKEQVLSDYLASLMLSVIALLVALAWGAIV